MDFTKPTRIGARIEPLIQRRRHSVRPLLRADKRVKQPTLAATLRESKERARHDVRPPAGRPLYTGIICPAKGNGRENVREARRPYAWRPATFRRRSISLHLPSIILQPVQTLTATRAFCSAPAVNLLLVYV